MREFLIKAKDEERRTQKQEIEMEDNLYSSLIISDRLIDHLDVILNVQDIIATPFIEVE